MMSELHWTGAAVLLALAVLGSGSAWPRKSKVVSWEDFAREHNLDTEPPPADDEPPCLAAVPVRCGQPRRVRTRRAS
jgi:hypothetical protein